MSEHRFTYALSNNISSSVRVIDHKTLEEVEIPTEGVQLHSQFILKIIFSEQIYSIAIQDIGDTSYLAISNGKEV